MMQVDEDADSDVDASVESSSAAAQDEYGPLPRKPLDLKGKLYLAPLTTVITS